MPKISSRPSPTFEDQIAAARREFVESPEWGRSRKGNLWRRWEGITLTVFQRNDGSFSFCVADGNGTRFANGWFETEEHAKESLAEFIGVGE